MLAGIEQERKKGTRRRKESWREWRGLRALGGDGWKKRSLVRFGGSESEVAVDQKKKKNYKEGD